MYYHAGKLIALVADGTTDTIRIYSGIGPDSSTFQTSFSLPTRNTDTRFGNRYIDVNEDGNLVSIHSIRRSLEYNEFDGISGSLLKTVNFNHPDNRVYFAAGITHLGDRMLFGRRLTGNSRSKAPYLIQYGKEILFTKLLHGNGDLRINGGALASFISSGGYIHIRIINPLA